MKKRKKSWQKFDFFLLFGCFSFPAVYIRKSMRRYFLSFHHLMKVNHSFRVGYPQCLSHSLSLSLSCSIEKKTKYNNQNTCITKSTALIRVSLFKKRRSRVVQKVRLNVKEIHTHRSHFK